MIASLLFLIDLFGKPVTLNFFGRDKFRSQFGGMCSVFFFGFLAWALYNSSADMFTRQNPTSITSEIYEEDPKAMTLTPDNFPIAVQVESPLAKGMAAFKNDSIFTVEFRYASISKDDFQVFTLAQESCTPSHFGEMADSFSQLKMNTSFCIAKEQPAIQEVQIQGVYTSPVNKLLVVVISPCNKNTSLVTCAPDEVIKEYLTGAWAYIYFTDMGVDPNNFTNPNSRFRTSYNTMMSPSTYKESYVYLSPVYVTTDAGWIMSEKETKTYIKVQRTTEQIQLEANADKMLLAFGFQLSTSEIYYSRSYKKIQNVLAEVGGLANVVLAALIVLTAPYLNLKLRESLINDLFDIHPIVPKKKKSKKKQKNKDIKDSPSTNFQDKNQDTDRDRNTVSERNKGNDMNETNYMLSSPNHKSLLKKEPRMSDPRQIEQSKTKRTGTMQTEGEPFYISPQISSYRAHSFLSNQEAKDSAATENKMNDKNYKDANSEEEKERPGGDNTWNKAQPNINLSKKAEPINTTANEHISLKIKGEDKTMTNSARNKVNMTKVMDKQNISDSLSVIFGEDGFPDTFRENNKQVLEFPLSPLSPLSSEQKDIEFEGEKEDKNVIEIDKINSDEKLGNNENITLKKSKRPPPKTLGKQPYRISLSFGEYLCSFFHQSESVRQKMQILNEGVKKLDTKIDIVTLLKKMREIDKLKAMLFDLDQARLFNSLPKPELGTKSLIRVPEADSSPYRLLRSLTPREQNPAAGKLLDVQSKLENKADKTEIDKRFIAIFREKNEKIEEV